MINFFQWKKFNIIFIVRIMMSIGVISESINNWLLFFISACYTVLVGLLLCVRTDCPLSSVYHLGNVLRCCGNTKMNLSLSVCLCMFSRTKWSEQRFPSNRCKREKKKEMAVNFHHVAVYVKWCSSKELLYRWFVWAANYKTASELQRMKAGVLKGAGCLFL